MRLYNEAKLILTLFIVFVFLITYIYFGYPIFLWLFRSKPNTAKPAGFSELPAVSILIPAYNEERHISNKIKNALDQDYPKDRLQVIIASDASTDRTINIARNFSDNRITIFESKCRKGKNGVLNESEQFANGDILIFTDANAMFSQDAIKKLASHFEDEDVGLVCGHLKYIKDSPNNVGKGEGLYFRYESLIKRLESRLGSVTVATGSIYAIRKSLFSPLEPDVANDFAHPVQVGAKGYKVLFEPGAIAFEKATSSISEEFKRRSRIVTRGFTAFGKYWRKYRLLRGLRGFCFFSHKLLRWFAPIFLLALFIINFFLIGNFFSFTFWAQIIFYTFALFGLFTSRGILGKIFYIPFYFCMINLAALNGFVNYLVGKRQAIWDVALTTREKADGPK